jgi:hypothetical protein
VRRRQHEIFAVEPKAPPERQVAALVVAAAGLRADVAGRDGDLAVSIGSSSLVGAMRTVFVAVSVSNIAAVCSG